MPCKEVQLPRVHHAVKKPKKLMWKDDVEREADKGHSTYHKVVATKKINKKNSIIYTTFKYLQLFTKYIFYSWVSLN